MAQARNTIARFARSLASAAMPSLLLALSLLALPAVAAPKITVSGPAATQGPIPVDPDGHFSFPNVPLKKNSVNTFTVTATEDGGAKVSKEIKITQLSLESVVVAKVKAEPLPPERIIQLVNDGVIDIEDPENFNVSVFQLVLTIGQREVPISVPVAVSKVFEETGFESISPPKDPGRGGGEPKVEDTEIIVFDKPVPCEACGGPISIPGVIVIEGRIKSLKEFYSVRLLLMNVSGIFTLHDVKANIEFPNGGLSATLPKDGTIAFDDILPGDGDVPGQKEREFIIRGDEIGTRQIRVSFGGFIAGPGIDEGDPLPFNGAADTSVEVRGPPNFQVRLYHPDRVVSGTTYVLGVEVTNDGDGPALYASLDLDVGADAEFVDCGEAAIAGLDASQCKKLKGPLTRNLRHLFPGERVREDFLVNPLATGDVTSCIGQADQNISLQVLIGNLGCLVGKRPSTRGVPTGVPTVSVLPFPNALGVGVDSPVTGFFSEPMDQASITAGGTFKVFGPDGNLAPGTLRFAELFDSTIAIWQPFGQLQGNAEYTVQLTQDIRDKSGNAIFNAWLSTFRTTDPNDDTTPPTLDLSIEPGVDPLAVIPGQLVRVNAYAQDQGTRVARVELRLQDSDVPDAPVEFVDQKTVFGADSGPCIFSVDSSKLVPGHAYQLRGTAFDGAGNAQDATLPILMRSSADVPTIALPADPAQAVLQGVSVTLTPLSVSSAVKKVSFFLDGGPQPFATLTLPPFQTSLGTLELGLGDHLVRAVAEDGLGQRGEDVFTFTLAENRNEPQIRFAGAVDGAQILKGSPLAVVGTATDQAGIRSERFALDDPDGPAVVATGGAVRLDTSALSEGLHRLFLIATNNLGVSNDPLKPDSSLDFVVKPVPNGPPPAPPVLQTLGPAEGGRVTVKGVAPAGARIDVTNVTRGLNTTVYANAIGGFELQIESDAGDVIRAVVFDLSQSQQPSAATEATVPAPRVLTSVRVLPAAVTLVAVNASQALTVTGFYADGGSDDVTGQTSFSSSDPTVASVGAGTVVALKRGTATVTASFGGFADTTAVTADLVTIDSITVEPASLTLQALGQTQALTVIGHKSDGTTEVLTSALSFASSAPGIAGVSQSGIVLAVANGPAQITVQRSGLPPAVVPVTVDSAQDSPPVANILGPIAGSGFERGEIVTVNALATDGVSNATKLKLTVTGATSFSETRQFAPTAARSESFSFPVAGNASVGAAITLTVQAEDAGGQLSVPVTRDLVVVDRTAPNVVVQAPASQALYNFGDTVEIAVSGSDAVGVTQLRFEATGALTQGGSFAVAPAQTLAGTTFSLSIPFNLTSPDIVLRAFARDAAGNEGASIGVPILITGADITPPETVATAASAPGASTITTVSYQVTSGLADLDHVELYFRRNGIGTFNRYTNAAGSNPEGRFTPEAGANGTIPFDATRMGGDGSYEFFTLGVDRAGNREVPPSLAGLVIGDTGALATFATGVEVVQITADTDIVNASLDERNLRVSGATLTVVGSHAFHNVELVNGARLVHRETTQTETFGLEVTAWTVSVDATSKIDVTGRGFLGGNKAGFGENGATVGLAAGANAGAGGSYGGRGGDYSGNGANVPNAVYGDLTNPVDLGSGGGAWGGQPGGDGGGRVLIGAINLANDGGVIADGGLAGGSAAGDGSGGAINLSLTTLSGTGAITASGGTASGGDRTGGGGGRVAIRYLDLATYDVARVRTTGGDGFYGDGADGSVFLLKQGDTNGEIVFNGTGPGSPFSDLILPPGQTFSSLRLQNGARVIAQGPLSVTGTVKIAGNSLLTHPDASEAGLSITAKRVEIDAGSAIDVTGRGYRGGNQSGFGESGATLGSLPGSQSGTGGSHAGVGGDYPGNGANVPGLVYGVPQRPTTLGGAGGAWGGQPGGAGGGVVRIQASEAVVVNGALRADGGLAGGSAAGDGAGGSVWITTSRMGGTGTVSANGGTAGGSDRTGGGGGRVAVYADFVDPNADLGALRSVTAFGGDGYYGDGAAGTVFLRLPGETAGTLTIDAGFANATAPSATTLPAVGPGIAAGVSASSLTVDGIVPLLPNGLAGNLLNPDTAQNEVFEIASNTADTLTVITPNANGVAFASVAGANKRYAGAWRFDALTLQRGGFLELGDLLTVSGTLALTEHAVLTHPDTTAAYLGALDLEVGNLTIDATSAIDVTGRGHLGGNRSGLGETARTLGFAAGAQAGTGGSYGGRGGDYSGNGANETNPVHGDTSDPLDAGSGGGGWGGQPGGDGGGRVFITASSLTVEGTIRANGARAGGSAAGDGSGGTVNIRTGTLAGAGAISADGGTAGGSDRVGGGGGRVAIRHTGTLSLPQSSISAMGGDGYYGDGGPGTVYLASAAQTLGTLVIDGFGLPQAADSAVLPASLAFDRVELRGQVRAIASAPIVVTGTLALLDGSTLTHALGNDSGLSIQAKRVEIDATSAIDVTGRGHLGGNKAGLGQTAHTLAFQPGSQAGTGGSHGGRGGAYAGSGGNVPGPVYGDAKRPVTLGGGGGAWGGNGGDGGGAVRIDASEAVVVDGAIRADGALSAGSASGEGAGGSIWITTGQIGGTGRISADGGTMGGATHVGGGGGRVAIEANSVDPIANLNDLLGVTALGGDGYYGDGGPGTVFFRLSGQTEGTLHLDQGDRNPGTGPASLPWIGPGVAAASTSDTLTVDGVLPLLPNGLIGNLLNPDTTQSEAFEIVSNTASVITLKTPNANGVAFGTVAGVGKTYAGVSRFDEVMLRRKTTLELSDILEVGGTLAVTQQSRLTHPKTTRTYAGKLDLRVGTLSVDATSDIDVTGLGHLGGNKTGLGAVGHTANFAPGAQGGTGGSYGGLGGDYAANGGDQPNPVYGGPTDPQDLGSGGGAWGGDGGDGGGRVLIVADSIVLNGPIRANGGLSAGSASGEGSGGSVNIRAGTFGGAGTISADGGTTGGGNHVGGGGGRVAIRYQTLFTLPPAGLTARGGDGYYGDGQDGTIVILNGP